MKVFIILHRLYQRACINVCLRWVCNPIDFRFLSHLLSSSSSSRFERDRFEYTAINKNSWWRPWTSHHIETNKEAKLKQNKDITAVIIIESIEFDQSIFTLRARLISISSSHFSSYSTFPRTGFLFSSLILFCLCMAHRPCRRSVFNHQNRFSTESKIDWSALIECASMCMCIMYTLNIFNSNLLLLCFLLLRLFLFWICYVRFSLHHLRKADGSFCWSMEMEYRCSRIAYLTLSISHGKKFVLNSIFAKR